VKTERVAKLMAGRGLCSRREAERLIASGQVIVDGVVVRTQGVKAAPDADIRVGAAGAAALGAQVTVILNKPAGIVSTQPRPGEIPAWTLLRADTAAGDVAPETLARIVGAPSTLAVAGRLDRASRGLLVLTQDGTIARLLIGEHRVPKTYTVRVGEPVTDEQVRKLRGRMTLDGRPLRPMDVRRLSRHVLRFVLVEGRKHQIRRVCRTVGLTVVDLVRDAVGPLTLAGLPEGRWRAVGAEETEQLKRFGDLVI